jgi:hypothetical protein
MKISFFWGILKITGDLEVLKVKFSKRESFIVERNFGEPFFFSVEECLNLKRAFELEGEFSEMGK